MPGKADRYRIPGFSVFISFRFQCNTCFQHAISCFAKAYRNNFASNFWQVAVSGIHMSKSFTGYHILLLELISTSQTFCSWVVIFHLRQPMEFLSLNLYDTPGLAPRMNVLYWGPGDFPVSYSNRDTSRNAWNCHSGSFMVDMGILFSNMKYPSHECEMTFWSLTNSDFPTIRLSTNFMTLIPSLTFTDYEWFPWSICNGCGMPAGNA